ncbi:GLPGLI family protein [candidate division KSB1 bacterium]
MKKTFFYSFVIALMFIFFAGDLFAQSIKGGVVKYRQNKKYDFEKVFNLKGNKNPEIQNWLAALPKNSTYTKVLYFTSEAALYQEVPGEKSGLMDAESQIKLQQALTKASYVKKPSPELEKVFYDFGKNEIIRQVEFMTRYFLVSGPMKNKTWKLVNKRVKVLDFTCMCAELKKGDNTVTAWFTPEIPLSAGPDEFYGLPGLILAVEINGEYVFVAESVDLTPPEKDVLYKKGKGKEVSQEEFSRIVEDKVKEWEEDNKAKQNKNVKKQYIK